MRKSRRIIPSELRDQDDWPLAAAVVIILLAIMLAIAWWMP